MDLNAAALPAALGSRQGSGLAVAVSLRVPPPLRPGDHVRLLSPASPPDRDSVARMIAILEGWGLVTSIAPHAFRKHGFLAGTDEERLRDMNEALRDPSVRALFATQGGKGSYRIADHLDFAAAARDPKFLVGFSDITALHLSLLRHAGLVGIHGALFGGIVDGGAIEAVGEGTIDALHRILMADEDSLVTAQPGDPTSRLTTSGHATGRLIGGCLDLVATCAGWALPDMRGAILLLEAPPSPPGVIDRALTRLVKGGYLDGIAGIALGQFTGFDLARAYSVLDSLVDHLGGLDVPILGGLPIGHGVGAVCVPIGARATLDADTGTLTIPRPWA